MKRLLLVLVVASAGASLSAISTETTQKPGPCDEACGLGVYKGGPISGVDCRLCKKEYGLISTPATKEPSRPLHTVGKAPIIINRVPLDECFTYTLYYCKHNRPNSKLFVRAQDKCQDGSDPIASKTEICEG